MTTLPHREPNVVYTSDVKPPYATPMMAEKPPKQQGTNLSDIQDVLYKNFTFSQTKDVFSCNVMPRQLLYELIHKTTYEIIAKGKNDLIQLF